MFDLKKVFKEDSEKMEQKFADYFNKYLKEQERKLNYVKSKEYLDWLIDFTNKYPNFNDDDFMYTKLVSDEDKTKCQYISWLLEYIIQLAKEQNIKNKPDKNNQFETAQYYFNFNNNYFNISKMDGQGTCTFISRLNKKPRNKMVIVPFDFGKEN